ncbi:hypothetical protein SPRG_02998 [Saprolegnia parasitica CBS 223.65]|uniref:RING-type domain-containing protein n=1 Tax=Saprolegnia parasitica (strain CBS 223.65) TaxID=695850 RepID=A0A067D157_SAPPC|nr:hypothetical protein SPRG_02998 [Saprolegnia parasitica CBS 223.65]KDO32521.1 hypothetical protein SPRG_02998 [Saprolegnia parasitica CBS 223.65]|eukprot:XP_012196970.1 hypothetical protein SPRG_02998 [Saprolegnia parasitica CBS 223.65]
MALPTELQNLVVLLFTCGLGLWAARLALLLVDLAAMRRSVQKRNVIYLPELGPSLSILEQMTTQRLQQYLRTQDQVNSFHMTKVDAPFDVVSNSLRVTHEDGRIGLSFDFQASRAGCSIETYWGVDATDFNETTPATASKRPTLARHVQQAWSSFTRRRQNSDDKAERRALNSMPSSSSPTVPPAPSSPPPDDAIDLTPIPDATTATAPTSVATTWMDDTPASYQMKSSSLQFPPENTGAYRLKTYTLPPVFPLPADASVLVVAIVFKVSAPEHVVVVSDGRTDPIVSETIFVDVALHKSPSITKRIYYTQSGRVHLAHELYGLNDFVECSICLEDPTRVIILPCRHCCVCPTCLNEIETCPICRTKFNAYITMDPDTSTALAAILPTSSAIV